MSTTNVISTPRTDQAHQDFAVIKKAMLQVAGEVEAYFLDAIDGYEQDRDAFNRQHGRSAQLRHRGRRACRAIRDSVLGRVDKNYIPPPCKDVLPPLPITLPQLNPGLRAAAASVTDVVEGLFERPESGAFNIDAQGAMLAVLRGAINVAPPDGAVDTMSQPLGMEKIVASQLANVDYRPASSADEIDRAAGKLFVQYINIAGEALVNLIASAQLQSASFTKADLDAQAAAAVGVLTGG